MTATQRRFIGDALFVTWAAITYCLVTCARRVSDETFGHAVLLWLTLSLPALGCIAFIVIRAALGSPAEGKRS